MEHLDIQQCEKNISLQDKIEEVLDITTNVSNYEQIFNTGKIVTACKLLISQKYDKFCRKLVKHLHKDSSFRINHEGLLVKQITILRNTYQVYVLPQRLVHCVIKIFHDNRGHQGISQTTNMLKRRFWFRKLKTSSKPSCEQLLIMLPAHYSSN